VGWLLLAALFTMWAAFLLPGWRRSPGQSVKDFERNMDLLADTEGQGRWIITPRKGMTFIGPRARAQVRARERRRRILIVLAECLTLTTLIGLVPPLRAMWYVSGVLFVLLVAYVWLLLWMKARDARPRAPGRARSTATAESRRPRHGHAARAIGRKRPAKTMPVYGGEDARVVVRPVSQAGAARS
jgi:hypothetical protein